MPSGNGMTELLRAIRNPLTAMQTTSPTMTARMFRRSAGIFSVQVRSFAKYPDCKIVQFKYTNGF
jgi:hypothetical protein